MFNARPFAIKFARQEPRIFAKMQLFSAAPLPGNHANSIADVSRMRRQALRSRDRLTTGDLGSEVLQELHPNGQPDLKRAIRDRVPLSFRPVVIRQGPPGGQSGFGRGKRTRFRDRAMRAIDKPRRARRLALRLELDPAASSARFFSRRLSCTNFRELSVSSAWVGSPAANPIDVERRPRARIVDLAPQRGISRPQVDSLGGLHDARHALVDNLVSPPPARKASAMAHSGHPCARDATISRIASCPVSSGTSSPLQGAHYERPLGAGARTNGAVPWDSP